MFISAFSVPCGLIKPVRARAFTAASCAPLILRYGGLEEAIRTVRESYPSKALNLLGAALGNASPVRLPALLGGAGGVMQ